MSWLYFLLILQLIWWKKVWVFMENIKLSGWPQTFERYSIFLTADTLLKGTKVVQTSAIWICSNPGLCYSAGPNTPHSQTLRELIQCGQALHNIAIILAKEAALSEERLPKDSIWTLHVYFKGSLLDKMIQSGRYHTFHINHRRFHEGLIRVHRWTLCGFLELSGCPDIYPVSSATECKKKRSTNSQSCPSRVKPSWIHITKGLTRVAPVALGQNGSRKSQLKSTENCFFTQTRWMVALLPLPPPPRFPFLRFKQNGRLARGLWDRLVNHAEVRVLIQGHKVSRRPRRDNKPSNHPSPPLSEHPWLQKQKYTPLPLTHCFLLQDERATQN